jgi:hypothetical protein
MPFILWTMGDTITSTDARIPFMKIYFHKLYYLLSTVYILLRSFVTEMLSIGIAKRQRIRIVAVKY